MFYILNKLSQFKNSPSPKSYLSYFSSSEDMVAFGKRLRDLNLLNAAAVK